MRMVLAGDVFALAHWLVGMPPPEQRSACDQMLQEAEWADKYRKRHGRCHPSWGNGSLMGRLGQEVVPKGFPKFSDPEFCETVVLVLTCLQRWRDEKRSGCWGKSS